MLGFWNKSVYITYLGVLSSVLGFIFFIVYKNVDYAFYGAIIAGVCDMFDGKVARKIPNRTEEEKNFGVEIDSLADIICSITIPVLTVFLWIFCDYTNTLTTPNIYMIIITALFIVAGIVRLAYFNVAMADNTKAIKVYTGVPVPASIIAFGLVWLINHFVGMSINTLQLIYMILVPLMGYLHICKIKVKKLTGNWFYITVTLVAFISILLTILNRFVFK